MFLEDPTYSPSPCAVWGTKSQGEREEAQRGSTWTPALCPHRGETQRARCPRQEPRARPRPQTSEVGEAGMLWAGPGGAGPRARLRGRRQRERSRGPPAQRALSVASEGLFGVPRGSAPFCVPAARTLLQVTDSSTPSHPAPATRIACYGVRWRVEGWEGCEGAGSQSGPRCPGRGGLRWGEEAELGLEGADARWE